MKKKFITIWRISVFTFATVLFVHLFTLFGAADSSVRVGRVVVPQSTIQSVSANQLTYK